MDFNSSSRKLFLLIFLSVGKIFSQGREEIYSFVNEGIQRNDTTYVTTHHECLDEKHSDVATLSFEANAEKYELRLQNYKDWENDGGDFRIIKLYHKGKISSIFLF